MGLCVYERLYRINLRLREEECTCQVLAAVAIEALCRNFEVSKHKCVASSVLDVCIWCWFRAVYVVCNLNMSCMKYSFMLSYTHFNENRLKYPDNAAWLILFIVFFSVVACLGGEEIENKRDKGMEKVERGMMI